MLENLVEKGNTIFENLKCKGVITEKNSSILPVSTRKLAALEKCTSCLKFIWDCPMFQTDQLLWTVGYPQKKSLNFTFSYGSRYSRKDQEKIFKGCLPQILLSPFLNTLAHIKPVMQNGKSYVSDFISKIKSFH